MLLRYFSSCLLSPKNIKPTNPNFKVVGIFNPGVTKFNNNVLIMARVAEKPLEVRKGYVASPRFNHKNTLEIDWFEGKKVSILDNISFKICLNSNIRLTTFSYFKMFLSRDGRQIDKELGSFYPENDFEEYGIEDPRIVKIGDIYYITYVAVSRHGACTALAETKDFKIFKRGGVIFPSENKDVLLFPEKIDNKYYALHRPNQYYKFSPPKIWIASSFDLIHWGEHSILYSGLRNWEEDRVGGGASPLKIQNGWLLIYHGASKKLSSKTIKYSTGAMLLDSENPRAVIGISNDPIMIPEKDYETNGFVPNVVFPTGILLKEDLLQIFYGAADTHVGVAEVSLKELLAQIN